MWADVQRTAAQLMAEAEAKIAAEKRLVDARRAVADRSVINRAQRRAAARTAREEQR